MSFNIALSGVAAAQKDLDVTANNIANVNTVGFKESRAEFGDVYATSLLAGSKTKVGDGVLTQDVAQQFSQGSLQFTNTALDLAITGNGFFATVPDETSRDFSFTRAGQFKLNDDNYVVNSNGDLLLGFPVNSDGTSSSVALSTTEPVLIPDSSGSPAQTSEVDIRMNLPASDAGVEAAQFDPEDPSTYNAATSVTVYDSLGDSHVMTYYFVKDDSATNEWYVATAVDDQLVNLQNEDGTTSTPGDVGVHSLGTATGNDVTAAKLIFSDGGDFVGIENPDGSTNPDYTLNTVALSSVLSNGADPTQEITIDFNLDPTEATVNEPTQYASAFEVTSLEQDGLPVGRLTGIDIGPDGLVRATFSNGTSEPITRVALVRFANEQGLTQQSSTEWKESILSGEALAGEATTGTYGEINSSALEQANVNLTTELIDMIIAQRNFQANSRALEVNNSLNQTILNIR
ncbi:MAG TPA: flagellar hook protein FlgE [Alteromonas australica]|uniref:Flagellar hook protein FlgE n=3 Tax=Alteromonas australica TaxID=589873 RepID=A0A350P7K8_9ALTE|nr:flagellar hook protein FlgE [Alteromonas australica]MAF69526.1 flagellar hook protein FlgE [Alteromonas sp.]HAW77275.1 flagellar hook protein FlgE [Alteromonas australica]|tara:strand:- start:88633 stop:90012 length:1380 start_codon:yes stop_codon:yes gene_type:complete